VRDKFLQETGSKFNGTLSTAKNFTIKIESLGVDAEISPVGLASDGSVDVPKNNYKFVSGACFGGCICFYKF
jgi:hypothetical protein